MTSQELHFSYFCQNPPLTSRYYLEEIHVEKVKFRSKKVKLSSFASQMTRIALEKWSGGQE